jgi:dihydroorotate dehydrogenase (fumarate)
VKDALEIPVIASLNGIGLGNWVSYAKRMQEAGADAIELNVYFIAADPDETGDEVEERYVKLVEAVRGEISIPLAVKIGPFFSSVGHMAHRLVAAGADGLVLFNRFMQPDIDLEILTVDPTLHLSSSDELLLPLRWIGILRDRVHASLAATTGVHTADDALKMLLVGADVVMLASALLRHGPGHIETILHGITSWMTEHDYASVEQLRGSMSQANVPNPVAFARANYAQLVTSFVSPYDWRMAHPEGELRA